MTTLTKADEERIQAILDEIEMSAEDPYIRDMVRALERTVDEAGVDPQDWEVTAQTSHSDWVAVSD